MLKKITLTIFSLLLIAALFVFIFAPSMVEKSLNLLAEHDPYEISPEAKALHQELVIADLHADSFLWSRDIGREARRGHVDIPRLQKGNVMLQMFTTVTKSPSGLNYDHNESDAWDDITSLAIIQRWPLAAWGDLTERAIHQAKRMQALADRDADNFRLIRSQKELSDFVLARQKNSKLVGGLIGTEGSHALEGSLDNIPRLYDYGFRMMSLQHFFDNKLGGSLHGSSGAGLSEFGKEAVQQMQSMDIMVDVSHSSEATVRDVLEISTKPLIVSHTGFKGHCESNRNISDELMQEIAGRGGLIGVGYWPGAICGTSPKQIAEAILYGVNLVGAEHVALGSDFDGSVETAVDAAELPAITQALLDAGADHATIHKVMGGNLLLFLQENLPVN